MIDLHTHTTFSDGMDSPTQLVQKAIEKKLVALAITDHDTLAGLPEGEQAALGTSLRLIRGVELEINYPSGEFHLLALNLGYHTAGLNQRLALLQEKRTERNHLMIEKMNAAGIEGSYDDIKKLGIGVIGRPHFAQHLINKGKVKNLKQAFDRYLAYGRPLYQPKEAIELEEAVSLIKEAGGRSVIAHPLSLYLSWGKLPLALQELRKRGVEGLEAYHSHNRLVESKRLEAIALELGFFITGGSDYHGLQLPNRKLGLVCKGLTVDDRLLNNLINY